MKSLHYMEMTSDLHFKKLFCIFYDDKFYYIIMSLSTYIVCKANKCLLRIFCS